MEEEINLATFQFDTAKLESSLNSLQDTMFALKKENQEYTEQMKAVQKATQDLTKEQLRLIGSNEELSDEYKENEKLLNDLNESEKQLYKNQQNVIVSQSRVKQEITATTVQLKAYMTAEAQQTTLMQSANVALANQITNINQARASNTELLRVRNQLNPAIEEENRVLLLLNQRLNENNKFIKENASEYEQQKINIGNYKESILEAYAELEKNKKSLEENKNNLVALRDASEKGSDEWKVFNQQINNTNTQINVLITNMAEARGEAEAGSVVTKLLTGDFKGLAQASEQAGGATQLMSNTIKGASTSFLSLAKSSLAFIATPIGALLAIVAGLFLLVKNAMDKNIQSADKVTSIFKALGSIFNTVLKVLEPIGTFLIDVLVEAFELLGNAAESALAIVASGLELLGFEDAADGVREFAAETKESTKEAYELAKAERELDQAQKRARLTQLEYQKGAEKLRQLRDDESKTIPERIQANKELALLLDEQASKELAIAQQALRVAEMRAKASKLDKTIQDDYIEALTQIADIEERITGQRSEQMANENSLRREAASAQKAINDKAIADAKARQDAAIKAMQTELDFYLESQGERKKSMEDQLAIDREVMRQSLAINKAEYDAKKLTRREFELANLEIQNEFASKQVEATIENANIEFELFKLNNQRKIEENQFFSDELYNQELDRINKIAEAEAQQQTLKLQNGLISAQEYNLAIATIDENQRIANEEAEATRNQAKKDQEAMDISIQDELNAERFEYDLALQMERYNREYAERKALAEKNGADMLAFEQAEALKKKAIEKAVQDNKLQLASNTLNNLSSILGKESAAGKAVAVAQATIDTYKAATSAYSAMAGIPVVGPVLGGIAAGAAVVAGLANVKKIVATKEPTVAKAPGYALGGKIVNGLPITRANGDNVLIAAKRGEAILNESQQRAIGASNLASAGVSGFSASGSSFVQNELTATANNEAFISAMSDAVYLATLNGSSEGSAQGLTNLSDNRQIMENAKF